MTEQSLRYEGWRVAATSAFGVFFASALVYTFPVFLKPLTESFSWSRTEVVSAYSLTAFMSGLSAAPLGYVLDRVGPRPVAILSLTLFACGFASLALMTPNLWHLYAAFGLLGVLVTGTAPIAYGRVVSSWFERRRGLALGIAVSGASIGAFVHPSLAQALLTALGWRATYLVVGTAILVIGVPLLVRYVHEGAGMPSTGTSTSAHSVLRASLGSRAFWILIVVVFASGVVQSSAVLHLSALLTDRGVSASGAALALSMAGAAGIAGRLITGWLVDQLFAPRVGCALLVIAGLGSFVLSGAESLVAGVVAAVLIGFGTGGETDVGPYLLSRYFDLRAFSTLYGLMWAATAAGSVIGPIAMGRAFDATGSYEAVLVRIAVVAAAIAGLMLAMPRYALAPVADTRSTPSAM